MAASGTVVHSTALYRQAIVHIGNGNLNATMSVTKTSIENSASEDGKSYVFGIMN